MKHTTGTEDDHKRSAWAARFETMIAPDTPYVPRAHLIKDAACAAAASGLPADATAVVVLQIEGVRDDVRARGWPFVDRRLTLTVVANRPGQGVAGPAAAGAGAKPLGALGWRRVAWPADEAAAWARRVGAEAETIMAQGDYDEGVWGARTAAYMVAMREHAKGRRPKPQRPEALGPLPDGRPVVAGWLGAASMPEVSDALALHLGAWPHACVVDT
ncbi:hypothetical protein [Pandoravirus japonicus]|uniref:Uncharacterized protein n=1 Tax=Pandoravirus japonicus TaxID=2823154 RepID=A0A811BMW2_9VIRU|nr:hypothetical protein [Pandoravirus japonicus]